MRHVGPHFPLMLEILPKPAVVVAILASIFSALKVVVARGAVF